MKFSLLYYLFIYIFNLFMIFAEAERMTNWQNFITTTTDETFKIIGNIIQQCKKNTGPTINHGNWSSVDSIISKSLFSADRISTNIKLSQMDIPQQYKRLNIYRSDKIKFIRKSYFAGNFILSVSSNSSLFFALLELKSSIWWNSEAFFFIINENIKNSCKFASEFFNTIWTFNIVAALYFCLNSNGQLSVYSFNPFSDSVPSFWKIVPLINDSSVNYKVLLEHVFEKSDLIQDYSFICNELFFDKTAKLNGFHIRAAIPAFMKSIRISDNATGFDRYKGFFIEVYGTVAKHMNLTATMKLTSDLSKLDVNGNPAGVLKELVDQSLDSEILGLIMTIHWRGDSRSIFSTGIRFLSLKRTKSFISSFTNIFTIQVSVFYAIVCIGGILILNCALKQSSISLLVLEYLRILTSQSVIRHPASTASRLVFFFLVVVVIVVSIHLQSQVSATVTVEELVIIDDVKDITEANLPVYGPDAYKEIMFEDEIYHRYQIKSIDECVNLIYNRSDVVCAVGAITMRYYAYESKALHISKKTYYTTSCVYTFREDWPLLHRFNDILLRILEGGFDVLIANREESINRRRIKIGDKSDVVHNIDKLKIGLSVFGFGLTLSVVIFCFEIIKFKKYKTKYNKAIIKTKFRRSSMQIDFTL